MSFEPSENEPKQGNGNGEINGSEEVPKKIVHRPPRLQTPPSPRFSPRASPRAFHNKQGESQDRQLSPRAGGRRASERSMRQSVSPRASNGQDNGRMSLYRTNTEGSIHCPNYGKSAQVSPRPGTARRNRSPVRMSLPVFVMPEITAEIKEYMEKALKGKLPSDLPESKYDEIIFALSKDRKNLATQHKYGEGEKYTRAIEHTKECQIKAKKTNLVKQANDQAKEDLTKTVQKLKDFDDETKRLEQEMLSAEKEAKQQIKQQHEKEIAENEALWQSEAKVKHYNRASPGLITLKKQINTMTVQCRFKDAEAVQVQYRKQKAKEEADNFALMQHDYDECLQKMLDRHKEEDDQFDVDSEIRIKHFHVKRNIERKQLENREGIMNQAAQESADPEKIWNKTANQRLSETCKVRDTSLPSTKMTRKDLADADFELLTLPPLDFKRNKKN